MEKKNDQYKTFGRPLGESEYGLADGGSEGIAVPFVRCDDNVAVATGKGVFFFFFAQGII